MHNERLEPAAQPNSGALAAFEVRLQLCHGLGSLDLRFQVFDNILKKRPFRWVLEEAGRVDTHTHAAPRKPECRREGAVRRSIIRSTRLSRKKGNTIGTQHM